MIKSMRYLWLIMIVAVALLLRGLLLLQISDHPQTALTPDSYGYLSLAKNLFTHGIFSRAMEPPFEAEIERTPLYPIFLAVTFFFSEDFKFALFVQCLLDVTICVLVVYLGWLVWDKRSALWAGFFTATSLGLIVYSVTLMSETLFTLLLILHSISVIVFLKLMQQAPNWRKFWPKLAITALTLAGATLTRPIALYFIVVEGCLIWWQIKHKWQHKTAILMLYILVYLMGLSPWIIRNWMIFGEPTVSLLGSYTLYTYYAGALEAYTTGSSYEAAIAQLEHRAQERFVEVGIADPSSLRHEVRLESEGRVLERFRKAGVPNSLIGVQAGIYRDMAKQIILRRPLTYFILHLAYTVKNFLPSVTELYQRLGIVQNIPSTLEVLKEQGIGAAVLNYCGGKWHLVLLALPAVMFLFFVYAIFFFGCYRLAKHRCWWPLYFIVSVIIYLTFLPGVMSEQRYGVPAMPFISLIAGYGMSCLRKQNIYRNPDPIALSGSGPD
jgi:4-amino-4-deoxy-L-arabinose transferase-like glycosyltransferase